MVTQVIKRNGKKAKFNKKKIVEAIQKAFKVLYELTPEMQDFANSIADDVANTGKEIMGVEEIQDLVETKLMGSEHKDVAKVYINYRQMRAMARSQYNELIDNIMEKLSAKNVQNQNANVDEHSFGGRVGEASSVVNKKLALDYIVSPMAKANHEGNMIYIHDLDNYMIGSHNCLSIPFDDLLAKGFNTRQTDVRPAGSVSTAFQLVAVIFQLQSLQQFGGVSATHIDWTMVPYVRLSFYKHFLNGLKYLEKKTENFVEKTKEELRSISIEDDYFKAFPKAYEYAMDLTKKEIHQSVEGLYHNLNTLQSRSGNQLPFTSINYGTCTLLEGRLVTESILKVSIEGLGKLHKTSIFPCGIFQYMKGVNDKPGTPNYDLYKLALESTSKRLYPNYANCGWSNNVAWVNQDRDLKQKVLDKLSEEDKQALIERGLKHPEELKKLSLKIIEE